MTGRRRPLLQTLAPGAMAALLPVIASALLWFGTGPPERLLEAPDVLAFNSVWTAVPFLLLFVLAYLIASVDRGYFAGAMPALALAGAGWLWVDVDGYRYQSGDIGGGANIGMIMLALAIVCAVVALTIALLARGRLPPIERDSDSS